MTNKEFKEYKADIQKYIDIYDLKNLKKLERGIDALELKWEENCDPGEFLSRQQIQDIVDEYDLYNIFYADAMLHYYYRDGFAEEERLTKRQEEIIEDMLYDMIDYDQDYYGEFCDVLYKVSNDEFIAEEFVD